MSKKFHYGWVVFAVSFMMVFVSLGFISSVKSLYLSPVTKDTGLSRAVFSLNDCFRYITVGVMNVFFGRFVEKLGPRRMIAAGFFFLTASVLTFSAANTALVFCIGGILLGLGLAWTTTTIVGYIVEKWFTNSKGTIMGFILAANGLGSAAASQILSPIITSSASGWRTSYRVTAGILVVIGVIVVSLIRSRPEDKGVQPLGLDRTAKKKRTGKPGLSAEEIFKKPYFYITVFCCSLFGMLLSSYVSTSSANFRDIGIDDVTIANVLSIYSILLFIAKTGAGYMFDRFGIRKVLTFCAVFGTVTLLTLAFTTGKTGAYIYSLTAAFGLPIETILLPLLTMEMFGKKAYARIMGIIVGFIQFGYCGGSLITNIWFDRFGTYKPVYLAFAVLMIIDTIIINICMSKAKKDGTEEV